MSGLAQQLPKSSDLDGAKIELMGLGCAGFPLAVECGGEFDAFGCGVRAAHIEMPPPQAGGYSRIRGVLRGSRPGHRAFAKDWGSRGGQCLHAMASIGFLTLSVVYMWLLLSAATSAGA